MSFEWQTEDEGNWEEESIVPDPPPSRRRWRFLLISLLGLFAVFMLVRWQINQQVSEATGNVEVEILAAHNFILQTAVSQDSSLFSANLSGRNLTWTEVQKSLLSDGLLLDRPMFGWQLDTDSANLSLDDVTIQLEPDLHGAQVIFPQNYIVQASAGVTETITLQQTAVYRLGTNRWLYSPPEDDFWGDWITLGGDYLTMVYPERDRELAASLGLRLDKLLGQMCDELADLNCPSDFHVQLRLSTSPDALLAINEIETVLDSGLQLNLPTLTMIGLPTDDASKEMVYRAYGVQVATAVLAHQIAYDCCSHQLFFRALRDYQLAELGLQPWLLTPPMYQQMLDNSFDGNVLRHWTRRWEQAPSQLLQVWNIEDPDPIWQQVYMFVEFLAAEETAVSPTQMMRLMDGNSYNSWLADVFPDDDPASILQSRFLQHIYARASAGQQTESPIPLPTGSFTLICSSETYGWASQVYTYNFAQNTWRERLTDSLAERYIHTADANHFLISEYRFSEEQTEYTFILATDEERVLLEQATTAWDSGHGISYNFADDTATYFMRYEFSEEGRDYRLQPTSCADPDCPGVSLPGWPLFSPNKTHLLATGFSDEPTEIIPDVPSQAQRIIYWLTSDGAEFQPLGRGAAPFWLNDAVYGFVRLVEDGWELVTAVSGQSEPRYLLNQMALVDELPPTERPEAFFVSQVAVNPVNPQELVLQLRRARDFNVFGPDTPSYLFLLTLTPEFDRVETVKLLREESFSGGIMFSPDGRFILHGDYEDNGPEITWHFYNAVTGQQELTFQNIGGLDWSNDGQWLIQAGPNFVLLRALAYDYQQLIPHGFGECPQVILSVED